MKRGNYMRLGKVIIISALLGVSTPFLVKQTPVVQAVQLQSDLAKMPDGVNTTIDLK